MTRTVKTVALYTLIIIPLFLIFAAKMIGDLATLDIIFWRVAAVVFLFLFWRLVVAIEKR